MLDTILAGGRVIDGTGNPWFKADVGIKDGRISAVGNLADAEAERTMDVRGLVVSPGFIDPHSHTDWTILKNNEAWSSLQQGVTTEYVGNCGMSQFPVADRNKRLLQMRMADMFGMDLDKVVIDWTDFAGFRSRVEAIGSGVNLACFVGHGSVRSAVMGPEGEGGERAEPTPAELEAMKEQIALAMEQGAWGLTTGLVYKPGRNAKTEEVIELARVAAAHGGSYMSHVRGYRTLDGAKEFFRIAEETPIRSVLSHHTARMNTQQKKLVGSLPEQQLSLFDEARQRGAEVYMDVLPWNGYSSTSMLSVLIEAEDKFDINGKRLTLEHFRTLLRDPEKRKEIEDKARKEKALDSKIRQAAQKTEFEFGDMYIINRSIRFPEYVERSLAEIARMRGTDAITAAADLVLEDEGNTFWGSWRNEGDVKQILSHPTAMVGTDGYAVEKDPPMVHLGDAPAVRLYGSFPKVLGSYVREDRVFSLEEGVRKMTSMPAQAIGLTDRGSIRPGMRADICVFDPDRIAHMATFFEPRQYCVGIEYVLVNGTVAMDGGRLTGALAGQMLTRQNT
ncbi:amidohydrolase family protein [Chloroflexota bacterium]